MYDLESLGKKAVKAKYKAAALTTEEKNKALKKCAAALRGSFEYLIAENDKDLAKAKDNGISEGMQDRLRLTKERIFCNPRISKKIHKLKK